MVVLPILEEQLYFGVLRRTPITTRGTACCTTSVAVGLGLTTTSVQAPTFVALGIDYLVGEDCGWQHLEYFNHQLANFKMFLPIITEG